MDLTMLDCVQTEDFVDPFDPEAPGFNETWWFGFAGFARRRSRRLVSFVSGGVEVARASIDESASIVDAYKDVRFTHPVVDVDFFEVASHRRGEGIGRRAAALILDEYRGTPVVAFSEGADGFWASAGWQQCHRRDSDPAFRTLFIAPD